jgi:hypothetical protein
VYERFQKEFLVSYFGKSADLHNLAKRLILEGRKDILQDLNKAVKVLGASVDSERLIKKLEQKYNFQHHPFWREENDYS